MIHTGDITHLSKPDEFDNANQLNMLGITSVAVRVGDKPLAITDTPLAS
jgi:hypothetical protein